MATQAGGTLERLFLELGRVLEPLETRLAGGGILDLFAELGLRFPAEVLDDPSLAAAVADGVDAAAELASLVTELSDAIEADDAAAAVETGAELVPAIRAVLDALDRIGDELDGAGGALPGIDAAAAAAFAAEFGERLLAFLVVEYLRGYHPAVLHGLRLPGLIELDPREGDPADPTKPAYVRAALHPDRLGELVSDPEALARTLYGWGDAAFDGAALLERLHDLLFALGVPAAWTPPTGSSPATLRSLALLIRPRTDLAPPGLEAALQIEMPADVRIELPFPSDTWSLALETGAQLEAGAALTLRPPAELALVPPSGSVSGALKLVLERAAGTGAASFVLIGQTGGSRIEAARAAVAAGATLAWDAGTGAATAGLLVEGEIAGGRLVVTLGGADGFLTSLLPPDGFALDFDFGIGWTSERGLYFSGAAALETDIGVHRSVLGVRIEWVHLALGAAAEGLRLEAAVTGGGALGPVAVAVERVGVAAELAFRSGSLGPVDLALAFRPPDGLGLVIDAGPVVGGGYLFFDVEKGEYAGAVQLEFANIALSAIGLLTTKLPDGSPGFSLLILIAGEFPPIQLGYGFTLNGVGGLLGVHRSVSVDALQAGIKSGSVDSVLFPENVVANAPRILSDLRAIFPPTPDQYVFGPMAILGWGTPTLLSLELGLLLELATPVRLVVLGQLKMVLPLDEAAIVRIRVDVLGIIDFDAGRASVDAVLYDSRVATFPLTGGMAMRADWGAAPNFALAAGGLHPRYSPPPGFPSLDRLAIALSDADNPRLRLEAYLALTSNTVQVGARLELRASAGKFSIEGELGFDTLFRLSPFEFVADIYASVALKAGSTHLMSVSLDFTLSGPTPWRARGKATFRILFLKASVRFDKRFGTEERPVLPVTDVWPLLEAALREAGNWSAQPPQDARALPTLREPPPGAAVRVHPLGRVAVRQRVVPLDVEIDRFGSTAPGGERAFSIASVRIGGTSAATEPVLEDFAPAQFFDMTEDEKLAAPSFEAMTAGVRIGTDAATSGPAIAAPIEYETRVQDRREDQVRVLPLYPLRMQVLHAAAHAGAAARSPVRRAGAVRFRGPGPRVELEPDAWIVASTDELRSAGLDGIGAGVNFTAAREALRRHLDAHPEDAGRLQVVPSYEGVGV